MTGLFNGYFKQVTCSKLRFNVQRNNISFWKLLKSSIWTSRNQKFRKFTFWTLADTLTLQWRTGTRLNWRRNSKKQDDSVEDLMLCYVRTSQLLMFLVSNWGNAQCILVRWKRGSSQRRALWSAENEALPQRKALWSSESEAKNHGKISNFPTFLLYLDYELLLRSLRSHRSKNSTYN